MRMCGEICIGLYSGLTKCLSFGFYSEVMYFSG